MQKRVIIIQTIILIIVFSLSHQLSWCIVGKMLLNYEYGFEKVKKEKLNIVEAKPYIIISNGDKITPSVQTGFGILHFILLLCFIYLFLKLINLVTKGWLFRSMKELSEFAKRKKQHL